MPRVKPRKQPCDCDRCVEPAKELAPIDPTLFKSLTVLLDDSQPHRVDLGIPGSSPAYNLRQQNLDWLVQHGSSGKLYFARNTGSELLMRYLTLRSRDLRLNPVTYACRASPAAGHAPGGLSSEPNMNKQKGDVSIINNRIVAGSDCIVIMKQVQDRGDTPDAASRAAAAAALASRYVCLFKMSSACHRTNCITFCRTT